MGAYPSDPWGRLNNSIVSPNLDNLAAHSMVFTRGFTAVSSCSPSRSALLTGMPIHQNGMYGLQQSLNHFRSFDENSTQYVSLPQTIGRILSNNGYVTGLIGKYHVAPRQVYYFDYLKSEVTGYDIDSIGRNITLMHQLMIDFLDNHVDNNQSFFLEMAFHDTHRGCVNNKADGAFCSYYGNGTGDNGIIPDWTPVTYDYKTLDLPYWIPDTVPARKDYASYLTSFSRLDQGVGLFLKEFEQRGLLNDTLIIFSSDNGPCFPSAKTNLYEEGQLEPYMISIPEFWDEENRQNIIKSQLKNPEYGKKYGDDAPGLIYTDYLASNFDILPTILDYLGVEFPDYKLNSKTVELTGHSLLDVVTNKQTTNTRGTNIFGSHVMHEVTMYYPMRIARNDKYRLIHNLYYQAPYHIASDLYLAATWQELLNNTLAGQDTHWFKNLSEYTFRAEWEMFDIDNDPMQLNNLAYNSSYSSIFDQLSKNISAWVSMTRDPWQCEHLACSA